MKQILTAAALLLSLTLQADSALHAYELMRLPHPLKLVVENDDALKLSETQRTELDAMMVKMPVKMHAMLEEAEAKERAIRRAVMHERKDKEAMAEALDELGALKRRVTDMHIDALNRLQAILDARQYDALLALLKAEHQPRNGAPGQP